MQNAVKALIAKAWKDESAELEIGQHHFDEEFLIRISGSVEKYGDQMVAPTVSIPLIPTLALFWEKCGLERDSALELLREAVIEAMQDGEQSWPAFPRRR